MNARRTLAEKPPRGSAYAVSWLSHVAPSARIVISRERHDSLTAASREAARVDARLQPTVIVAERAAP